MMVYSTPISSCIKTIVCSIANVQRQVKMNNRVCAVFQTPSSSCYTYNSVQIPTLRYSSSRPSMVKTFSLGNGFQELQSNIFAFGRDKDKTRSISLPFKSMVSPRCYRKTRINVSSACQNMNFRLLGPKRMNTSNVKFVMGNKKMKVGVVVSSGLSSHGKKVLINYSLIGIPGDGRCLFRSVAHGACVRSGKSAPNESLQRQLADELRERVADDLSREGMKRNGTQSETLNLMSMPHVWGGEPELLMASHVLQMPITVYMHDRESGGLISISEYGQEEYGNKNPIDILYHCFGHYDGLHLPRDGGARPRL